MTKIIISMLLLLNLNLFAETSQESVIEYKKACKDGDMNICTKLGVLYYTGNGVKQNHKKARKFFVKSCKKRRSRACYHLGTIYKRGADGIERNTKRARMFYALGCELGYLKSCDQYNLIREKREVVGSGTNTKDLGYTYTTEIYGG